MAMSFPTRLVLTIAGTIVASIGAAYLLGGRAPAIWLPLAFSIASLTISILAAFKSELFDFAPVVIQQGYLLAQASPPTPAVLNITLPLHFLNRGYGEGVIESIALKVWLEGSAEPIILTPAAELDLQKFVQGLRRLHPENIIGPFCAFPLEAKASRAKTIVFSPEKAVSGQPVLKPGKHRIEVFLRASNHRVPFLALEMPFPLTADTLAEYAAGKSIHDVHDDIAARLPK